MRKNYIFDSLNFLYLQLKGFIWKRQLQFSWLFFVQFLL